MAHLKYSEQVDRNNIYKLRQMLAELPPYCKEFFRSIELRTQSRTRIAYAYDLKVFFRYLLEHNPALAKTCTSETQISMEMLGNLEVTDIEEYMEYLKYRTEEEREILNKERGIKRKLSSLKSFFKYFYYIERLENNIMERVSLPRFHEKEILRLDMDEVAMMLEEVQEGTGLTKRQKIYHEKTKIRDQALLSLMLGTGIRVSECVGLNLEDVDLKNDGIRIHRKGGKEVTVYFSDEVEDILQIYLKERRTTEPAPGHEEALFLSLQNKRLTVRSLENLVNKYARIVSPLKKITPHQLRSTYGTTLYKETGDIYLVADVLGHSDVNTTKKHYAALEDDRRKSARNKVRLREETQGNPYSSGR